MDVSYNAPLAVYFSGYEECAPGHSFGPAVREQYLLHFVLSGKGQFRTAGQTYRLESGSVFLIQPGQLTYYEADPEHPWRYCWVGFGGSDAEQLMAACGLLDCPVRSGLPATAGDIALQLYRAYTDHRGNPILYQGLLYQFFSCLSDRAAAPRPAAAGDYLNKAAEYIRRNYMYDISVSGVSAYVGIDRSYLYRLFRQWQDISPQQYLLQCRLEAARRMLLESGYSITEIACSCGFRELSAFDKAFRHATGQSPSAFRHAKTPGGQ